MLDRHGNVEPASADSSSASATPPQRRQDVRQITIRRVAKLRTPLREELCLVRNISPQGLMAHVYSRLNIGDRVTAEFSSGQVVEGRIVWQRDDRAGMQFDQRVDTASVLGAAPDAAARHPPRALRVELDIDARIRVGTSHRPVMLRNISQSGARIQSVEPCDAGQKLVLKVDGLPPLAGRVRWQRDGLAGIAFNEPMAFDMLAQWVPMVQRQAR